MIHLSEIMPDVDCLNIPAPHLTQIALQYDGPIIRVTMFVDHSENEQSNDLTWEEINNLRLQHNRTNIRFVHGTRYIHEMNRECRGLDRLGSSDCGVEKFGTTHVCTGPHGGHADLIAFDVIERLYEVLEEDNEID
jgi:hypothetical protein